MALCTVDGCDKGREAHGFCVRHLRRWQRYGDPHKVAQIKGDDVARFHAHIATSPAGCWLWTGALDWTGYARFSVGLGRELAHRWSYKHFVGPILDGHQIDHLCRVRHCVNPKHLEPATARENTLRSPDAPAAINAAKVVCLRSHPFDSANTHVNPKTGHRNCRACKRERARLARRAERSA